MNNRPLCEINSPSRVTVGELAAFIAIVGAVLYVSKMLLLLKLAPTTEANIMMIDKWHIISAVVSFGISPLVYPLAKMVSASANEFYQNATSVGQRMCVLLPFAFVGVLLGFNLIPIGLAPSVLVCIVGAGLLMLAVFDMLGLFAIVYSLVQITITSLLLWVIL